MLILVVYLRRSPDWARNNCIFVSTYLSWIGPGFPTMSGTQHAFVNDRAKGRKGQSLHVSMSANRALQLSIQREASNTLGSKPPCADAAQFPLRHRNECRLFVQRPAQFASAENDRCPPIRAMICPTSGLSCASSVVDAVCLRADPDHRNRPPRCAR